MASKKTLKKSGSDHARELARLHKVSRRAKAEVAGLLKRSQKGTITRVQLQTGLKEVEKRLTLMDLHFFKL
jgi:hypothetical protein